MPLWEAFADSLGLVIVGFLLIVVSLFVRRRLLGRGGATFECSVRIAAPLSKAAAASSRGWALGLGRYAGDDLQWFRIFSFSPRPREVFERGMKVVGRRDPHGAEAFSLYAGHIVVEVMLADGQHVEMSMSERALTGFLAWSEAAPPGHERLLS